MSTRLLWINWMFSVTFCSCFQTCILFVVAGWFLFYFCAVVYRFRCSLTSVVQHLQGILLQSQVREERKEHFRQELPAQQTPDNDPNVCLMLVHRLRRWPNIKPTLDQRLCWVGSVEQLLKTSVLVLCIYIHTPHLVSTTGH